MSAPSRTRLKRHGCSSALAAETPSTMATGMVPRTGISGTMLHDVHHGAVGSADHEPPNSPGFGAERVHDVLPGLHSLGIGGTDVVRMNRHV